MSLVKSILSGFHQLRPSMQCGLNSALLKVSITREPQFSIWSRFLSLFPAHVNCSPNKLDMPGSHSSLTSRSLLQPSTLMVQPVRTKRERPKYSRILWDFDGNARSVEGVLERFYRLDNGLWIRTQAGRRKRRWKKSPRRVYRLQQHVFCTKNQSKKFDKMVNIDFRIPKTFFNDPYEVYHRRSNLPDWRYDPPKFLP